MPAKSRAQQRYMGILAHDPAKRKAAGIPQAVAEEFAQAPGGTVKGLPERKMRPKGSAPLTDADLAQGYRKL